jgi:hypothetical protein
MPANTLAAAVHHGFPRGLVGEGTGLGEVDWVAALEGFSPAGAAAAALKENASAITITDAREHEIAARVRIVIVGC